MNLSHYKSSFPPFMLHQLGETPKARPVNLKTVYVWPHISKENFAATMQNFYAYRQAYNDKISLANSDIDLWNTKVKLREKKHPPSEKVKSLLKKFTGQFHTENNCWEYNAAAESFCQLHGLYIRKRKIKPLRDTHINTFAAILHHYQLELKQKSSLYKSQNRQFKRALPFFGVHPYEISKQRRSNNVYSLTSCDKTIRNHRTRLIEAGILVYENFHGRQTTVDYSFNPSILEASDQYSLKTQNAENETPTSRVRKKLPDMGIVTEDTLKENKKNGNVDKQHSRNSERASRWPSILNYRNTTAQVDEILKPGHEKNTEKTAGDLFSEAMQTARALQTPTEATSKTAGLSNAAENGGIGDTTAALLRTIDTVYDLSGKCADGVYNYYSPIPIPQLREAAKHLTDNDFWDFVVNDFVRSAAQLNHFNYNGSTAASWNVAIRRIIAEFETGTRNFKGHAKSTETTLEKLKEFRYRLNWAVKWCTKKKKNDLLYAAAYFDPARTEAHNVAWAYTQKIYNKKLKRAAKVAADKQRQQQKTKINKEFTKLKRYIQQFLRGERSLQWLDEKVLNMSKENQNKYLQTLQNENNKRLARL